MEDYITISCHPSLAEAKAAYDRAVKNGKKYRYPYIERVIFYSIYDHYSSDVGFEIDLY